MSGIVRLRSDVLEVEIWTLGARLNGVWFEGGGSLVDGVATDEEALGAKEYNGAVVGPVANRIAGAKAEIDGRLCNFEANERERTTLHSGSSGVHAQEWTILERTDNTLALKLDLNDGLGGFPGKREILAEYSVHSAALAVVFQAKTDAPTWISLALHPYWRLAQEGRAGAKLFVDADTYLPVDSDQIPTGEQAPVDGTLFDHRTLRVPSSEIDHNFCLNPMDAPRPAVSVEGDLGVRMDVVTDAPGMQVYSGKDIGIAIEPQHWPDAMHHPNFPSIELHPGDRYIQSTTYRFSRL